MLCASMYRDNCVTVQYSSLLRTNDAGIFEMAALFCACAGPVLAFVDWMSHEIMDVNDLGSIIEMAFGICALKDEGDEGERRDWWVW